MSPESDIESNPFLQSGGGFTFGANDIDCAEILRHYPSGGDFSGMGQPDFAHSRLHALYRARWLPFGLRHKLWSRCRQTSFDLSWFASFRSYWQEIIGGRPLWGPEDLYFLRGLERLRFANLQVPDNASADVHAEAYRQPAILYFLLHQVFKEKYVTHANVIQDTLSLNPSARSFLEYGSGIGPICASYLEFFGGGRSIEFHLADLEALNLQYAAYRFAKTPNVVIHPLLPENDLQLSRDISVDVVFCLTVFEHMNQPLRTARRFHSLLREGGVLAFDYILGEGDGLDTRVAAEQRRETLEFIDRHFDTCSGEIEMDRSIGLTICRKRGTPSP